MSFVWILFFIPFASGSAGRRFFRSHFQEPRLTRVFVNFTRFFTEHVNDVIEPSKEPKMYRRTGEVTAPRTVYDPVIN
jgi:hypothetical protein